MNEIKQLKEMPQRNPINGTFELTIRCNLHCKMCLFRHDDSENAFLMAKELTAEQWIDMARQAAEVGTMQLLITGGEPLLRSDFCEIWEEIYKLGFILELYTNATLVTPKIMKTLRKYPPHMIGVTIYGASPETYEAVCGNAEAFQKTIDGIKMLQTLPSVLSYRTTLIKDNYQELDEMENLLREEFDTDALLTNTRIVTKAVRGACADVETCRLSAKEMFELSINRSKDLLKKRHENIEGESCIKLVKLPNDEKKQLSLFGCNAGMSNYTITWEGLLQGCQILGVFTTDAIKYGLKKSWEDFPLQVKLPSLSKTCQKCEEKNLCECCYAFRYAETGDLQGVPEYICENTRIASETLRRNRL